jgi:predicted nucleotidyltransferase
MIIEGFYIETPHIVYAVKGICSYDNFIPVVPKYYKTGCEKVKEKGLYCYRKYLPSLGITSCVVREEDVSTVYNPFEYSIYRLPREVRSFIEYLRKVLNYTEIGVTGSYLLGCPRESSDIDLIIYGESLYNEYTLMRNELSKLNRCSDYLVKKNYIEKISVDNSMDLVDYKEFFNNKILEGCYHGKLYSIRIIERGLGDIVCKRSYYNVGHSMIKGELKHLKQYTTPAIYTIQDEYSGYSYNLMTWRIRYTELPEGFYEIQGDTFVDSTGRLWIIPDHGGRVKRLYSSSWKSTER